MGRFSTHGLEDSTEDWARLMFQTKALPRIGLVVVTAMLLFQPARRAVPAAPAGARQRSHRRWAFLVAAQLAAFALLFRSTAAIFEERLVGVRYPLFALAEWVALVMATAGLGLLLLQPLSALLHGLSRRAPALLGACFLGLTAWGVGQFAAENLSESLRGPTLWLASKLIMLFEQDGFSDAAKFIFGTRSFSVHIEPVCSGFEGMGLTLVFASAYLLVFRGQLRFPRALLIPLAGVACAWLLNVLRLVALVLIGTHGSRGLAVGIFHSLAGTLAFCAVALGLIAISRRMRFFTVGAAVAPVAEERDGTAAYLAPFLVTVALGMVISAFGESGRALEVLKPIAAALALTLFWGKYAIDFRSSWIPGLLLGSIAFTVWIVIPRADSPQPADAWLGLRVVSSLCVEPLVEELAFRGFLMRRLCTAEFERLGAGQVSMLAWGLSSLAFSALHGHWIACTIAGAAYGYAYMRSGRIFDAILAHTWTNLLLVVLAAVRGDWSAL